MSVKLDWSLLSNLPGAATESFEKFCFHIANRLFGEYGTVDYCYNTPGSEFYITLNQSYTYSGKKYIPGDIIGLQAKFWLNSNDVRNSPLSSGHISELERAFQSTLETKGNIKLWIICTPGAFVQNQWLVLKEKLIRLNSDCEFECWHKDIFEAFYLRDIGRFNGIFQHFFGLKYFGKEKLDSISQDTLFSLRSKYDVDLHTASDFEKTLLSMIDDNKAMELLFKCISSLKRFSDEDKQYAVLEDYSFEPEMLTSEFKDNYIDLFKNRYSFVEKIDEAISAHCYSSEIISQLINLLSEYKVQYKKLAERLNNEIQIILKREPSFPNIRYYLDELVSRTNAFEEKISSRDQSDNNSLEFLLDIFSKKDFSIFAEAGYGKTHFACSIADFALKNGHPVLFLVGAKFRHCSGVCSKLVELLDMPASITIDDLLDLLDFQGEIYKCKIPIIIDGLNESAPNEDIWYDELPRLRRRVRNRKHLLLITTCREKEEYVKVVYGCRSYSETENPIRLSGFKPDSMKVTMRKYFKKYDIHPIRLRNHNLFENPLLLKMFCIVNKGRSGFELNDYSLASCLKDYSDRLVDSISREGKSLNCGARLKIERGMNEMAQLVWKRNERGVDYLADFVPLFDEYADSLLDEGLCLVPNRFEDRMQVSFSYDMVAGYYIAKSIVDSCKTREDFKQYINKNYNLLFGSARHTLSEDVCKSLFYLVPLMYKEHWFGLMPDEEIIISAMDHLDIIVSDASGKNVFQDVLISHSESKNIRNRMCDCLFNRIVKHDNLLNFSVFLPFLSLLKPIERDEYLLSRFSGEYILKHVHYMLHNESGNNQTDTIDKLTLAALLCGITDKEYREKFYTIFFDLVENNGIECLYFCRKLLDVNDPFVFESVVSVVTGVGIRSQNLMVLNESIQILEDFLKSYTSNHVVLLDDLDTLYAYKESIFNQSSDKSILRKNIKEVWPVSNDSSSELYSMYDYDFEKFILSPLYKETCDSKSPFASDVVKKMLLTRAIHLGYEEELCHNLQTEENGRLGYRRSLRYSYAYKYGRQAVLELYGWAILNSYLEPEFPDTFRTPVIDIDPSFPKFSTRKRLVTRCYLPNDSHTYSWLEESSIDVMKQMFVTTLPGKNGLWIMMNGQFLQKINSRRSQLYLSGICQLVPENVDINLKSKNKIDEVLGKYHVFAGELGWRDLKNSDDYANTESLRLLTTYSFSNWNNDRFDFCRFTALMPEIVQKFNLYFDIKTMSYTLNGDSVSEYFLYDTDEFFYLRKDIVDQVLRTMGMKLRFHIYEQRQMSDSNPDSDSADHGFSRKYNRNIMKQSEDDLFY